MGIQQWTWKIDYIQKVEQGGKKGRNKIYNRNINGGWNPVRVWWSKVKKKNKGRYKNYIKAYNNEPNLVIEDYNPVGILK